MDILLLMDTHLQKQNTANRNKINSSCLLRWATRLNPNQVSKPHTRLKTNRTQNAACGSWGALKTVWVAELFLTCPAGPAGHFPLRSGFSLLTLRLICLKSVKYSTSKQVPVDFYSHIEFCPRAILIFHYSPMLEVSHNVFIVNKGLPETLNSLY